MAEHWSSHFSDLRGRVGLQDEDLSALLSNRHEIATAFAPAIASTPTGGTLVGFNASGERAALAQQNAHWQQVLTFEFGPAYQNSVAKTAKTQADQQAPPGAVVAEYGRVACDGLQAVLTAQAKALGCSASATNALSASVAAAMRAIFCDAAVLFGQYQGELLQGRLEAERQRQEAETQKLKIVVGAMARVARDLSNKNLGTRPVYDLPEEYTELGRTMDNVVKSYWGAVSSVGDIVLELQSAMQGIAVDVSDLSHRTAAQSENLQESSEALHRVNETSSANEAAARSVAGLAEQSDMQTQETAGAISKAMEAMSNIETSAEKISQVVAMIDGIALQTNLLALNASVEAARAGQAGAGFSVVAQEVRALSTRCLSAATEIKSLVTESEGYIGDGVGLVREAQANLDKAVGSISETDRMSAQIAIKVSEQSGALQDIDAAVSNLQDITRQNADMVVQTESRIETLNNRIGTVAEEFRSFNLDIQEIHDRPVKVAV